MEEMLTLIEKTAFLKSIDVLSGMPTEALLDLAERAEEKHLDPGDVVFAEGEPNRGTFLVVEGILEQRKGRALIRIIEPRMAAGELWLGEGEPHNYTVLANTHAHVLKIDRGDVDESIMEYPEIGIAMVRVLSLRLHELIGRILDLETTIQRLHDATAVVGVRVPGLHVPDNDEPAVPPSADEVTSVLGTGATLPPESGAGATPGPSPASAKPSESRR